MAFSHSFDERVSEASRVIETSDESKKVKKRKIEPDRQEIWKSMLKEFDAYVFETLEEIQTKAVHINMHPQESTHIDGEYVSVPCTLHCSEELEKQSGSEDNNSPMEEMEEEDEEDDETVSTKTEESPSNRRHVVTMRLSSETFEALQLSNINRLECRYWTRNDPSLHKSFALALASTINFENPFNSVALTNSKVCELLKKFHLAHRNVTVEYVYGAPRPMQRATTESDVGLGRGQRKRSEKFEQRTAQEAFDRCHVHHPEKFYKGPFQIRFTEKHFKCLLKLNPRSVLRQRFAEIPSSILKNLSNELDGVTKRFKGKKKSKSRDDRFGKCGFTSQDVKMSLILQDKRNNKKSSLSCSGTTLVNSSDKSMVQFVRGFTVHLDKILSETARGTTRYVELSRVRRVIIPPKRSLRVTQVDVFTRRMSRRVKRSGDRNTAPPSHVVSLRANLCFRVEDLPPSTEDESAHKVERHDPSSKDGKDEKDGDTTQLKRDGREFANKIVNSCEDNVR